MKEITISCSIALGIILLILFLLRSRLGSLLKDFSTRELPERSYSLSRSILFFWTIIIFISICYIGIKCNELPRISPGVLILMGIVVGTSTTGRIIDTTQEKNRGVIRFQNTMVTEGFLDDILSDKDGMSISRLQTFIFNVIYGCVFISIVITKESLYDFPAETLTLLGISSGAYALLKVPENS